MLDQHAADAGIDPGTGKVGTATDRFQAKLCCLCEPPPLPWRLTNNVIIICVPY